MVGSMYSQANVKPFGVFFWKKGCWRLSPKERVEKKKTEILFFFKPKRCQVTKPKRVISVFLKITSTLL